MFKTTEAASLFPNPMGQDGVQFWSLVEHEIPWPWFYLQVVQEDAKAAFRTMLMLSSTEDLAAIASTQTHEAWLEKAYLVTPGDINGSSGWQLEGLLKVEVLKNVHSSNLGARFYVENGQIRSLGEVWQEATSGVHTCFCAEKHLGRVASKG